MKMIKTTVGFAGRKPKLISKIIGFALQNAVLVIAASLAILTSVTVPPDREYLGYIDFKTLSCLFSTLAVVGALRNIGFFTYIARKIVALAGNLRLAATAVVFITFFGSMLIANDMALITFLPLGYLILKESGKLQPMAYLFIMQNIAANLGGMLTPFGNPQNLYLYTKYNIPNLEFMSIMLAPFLAATVMILVCCLFFKSEPISLGGLKSDGESERQLPPLRLALYLALFALSIVIVFRLIPYVIGLAVITAALLVADRRALREVDYGLLATFFCFFIFAGNMSRIPLVQSVFDRLLDFNTLVFSTLSCQLISNVPSAILLSQFTDNYRDLLRGVNIGGTGTLIASLASLITFREYVGHRPGKAGKYMVLFTAMNVIFAVALLVLCLFV